MQQGGVKKFFAAEGVVRACVRAHACVSGALNNFSLPLPLCLTTVLLLSITYLLLHLSFCTFSTARDTNLQHHGPPVMPEATSQTAKCHEASSSSHAIIHGEDSNKLFQRHWILFLYHKSEDMQENPFIIWMHIEKD